MSFWARQSPWPAGTWPAVTGPFGQMQPRVTVMVAGGTPLAREVWEAAALNRDVLCREYLLDEREAPAAIAERRPDFAVLCDPSDDALVDEILAALEERAPHAATRVVVIAPAAGSHILIAVNALDPAEDVLVAQITGHLTD
jgi:hypothetical protein